MGWITGTLKGAFALLVVLVVLVLGTIAAWLWFALKALVTVGGTLIVIWYLVRELTTKPVVKPGHGDPDPSEKAG